MESALLQAFFAKIASLGAGIIIIPNLLFAPLTSLPLTKTYNDTASIQASRRTAPAETKKPGGTDLPAQPHPNPLLHESAAITPQLPSPRTPLPARIESARVPPAASPQSQTPAAVLNLPADASPLLISLVNIKDIGQNAANIEWVTSKPADSQIEFGLASAGESQTPVIDSLSMRHLMGLTNLSAGQTFYFRLKSADPNGNIAVSDEQSFTTLPPELGEPSEAQTSGYVRKIPPGLLRDNPHRKN